MSANAVAVELARIILEDTEADRPDDLSNLTVREARIIAHAVERVIALADRLDREAFEVFGRPLPSRAGRLIRAALEGENHE